MAKILTCDGKTACPAPVAYVDEKGFLYCTACAPARYGWRRRRKLRPHEIRTLSDGGTIRY